MEVLPRLVPSAVNRAAVTRPTRTRSLSSRAAKEEKKETHTHKHHQAHAGAWWEVGLGVGGGRRQQMDSGGEGVRKGLNGEGLVGGGKEGKEK